MTATKEENTEGEEVAVETPSSSPENFIKKMLGECDKKKVYFMDLKNQNLNESCFSTFNLEILKTKIEKMTKIHHIEILKILKEDNSIKLNENKSGVFVNLSFLPKETIVKLYNYVDYIEKQENSISDLESKVDTYKKMI